MGLLVLFVVCLFLSDVAIAEDIDVSGTLTLDSDKTVGTVTGRGTLILNSAILNAGMVDASGLNLDMDGSTLISQDRVTVKHMELNNSWLEAKGRISGTVTAPRQLFLENSTILSTGGDISLGEGYSGFHIHNESTIQAHGEVMLYGGLRVLQGESRVIADTGSIFGNILEALGDARLHVQAPNGDVTSNSLIATTLEAQSLHGINVTVREEFDVGTVDITRGQGSLVLPAAKGSNTVRTALNLANARAEVNGLTVEGTATISGGSFSGQDVVLKHGATFSGGARAGMETLELTETLLAVNSRVAVNNLNGTGNIVVGANAAVGLGTADVDWIERQFSTADGSSLAPVTAALAVAQSRDISGVGILVDGNATTAAPAPSAGTARFAADSLLVVSAAAADQGGAGALRGGTFTVDSGAKLYIPDAVDGGRYHVLGVSDSANDITYGADAWTGDNLLAGTPLLALERRPGSEQGWFYAHAVSAAKAFTRLHPYLVDMLDKAYAEGLIGYSQRNSDIPGIRFLSRAISREYIANDGRLAAATIESAARMAALGAVPQMTMAANQAGSNAMGGRTGAEPEGGIRAVGEDGAPVEEALNRHGWALWIMPIFQSTNGFGMTAGNWDMDFSGNLGGIALGCDYTFASALRLGVSLNLGGGYARGSGELAGTTNSMGFWGLGAYAGWRTGNLGLSADVAYTSAYNSLKQGLPEGMEMRPLKSDVTSWALSSGLRADYRIPTPWLDVTPHAGVRYLYLQTNGYDVKSNGTVLEGDPMRQNIWTFPVGVSLSREFGLPHGWRCRPVLDFAVIPAAGDMDAKGDVRFTGTGIDSDLETQIMDHVTWRGAFGMEFTGGDLALGLAYSFQGGMKTTAHGVTASFSYQF
ncbi:autotransporter outer membrane beta-barrel domain-containing protein [uncultured Desulfovibrio sp.]|uniref:autotransporter family protein n=1 Tax=uncultured Desulfovibrio sp. TaxID=167968 RepID=UPI002806204D|nr:autotransporter outer membrane beta-barrel domain-containing protein [uncultured Desulfovibrio sp.]